MMFNPNEKEKYPVLINHLKSPRCSSLLYFNKCCHT